MLTIEQTEQMISAQKADKTTIIVGTIATSGEFEIRKCNTMNIAKDWARKGFQTFVVDVAFNQKTFKMSFSVKGL